MKLCAYLFRTVIDIDQLDLAPWGHQRSRGPVRQPHDARNHRGFFALDHAGALRLGKNGLDLLIGDAVATLSGLPEKAEHQTAGRIEKPDQRQGELRENGHRRGDFAGHCLGRAERNLLRHEFTDDQREIGDRHDDCSDAEGVGQPLGHALGDQPVREAGAERRA